MPKQMLVEHSKDWSISLKSDNLYFKTAASSTTLKDAIKRYKTLTHNTSRHKKCSSLQVVEINTVVIVLISESEALNIDTSYDYELTISKKTNDVTVVANSPFGAMYVSRLTIVSCEAKKKHSNATTE